MSEDKNRCRACLSYGKHYHNLESSEIRDMFVFCISMPVTISDVSPKALCNECYNLLIKFGEFKRLCMNSEEILSNEEKCSITKGQYEPLEIFTCEPKTKIKMEKSEIDMDTMKEVRIVLSRIVMSRALPVESDDSITNGDPDFNLDSIGFDDCSSETSLKTEVSLDIKREKKFIPKTVIVRNKKSISKAKTAREKKCVSKTSKKTKRDSDEDFVLNRKNPTKTNNKFILECSFCNSKYKNEGALKVHEAIHRGIKIEHKCDICNKKFKLWYSLRRHLRRHAIPKKEKEPQTCTTCGKVFKTGSYLKLHMRSHEPKPAYICHICAKVYVNNSQLNEHIKVHMNDRVRKYECEFCKKKYFTQCQLKTHVKHIHFPKTIACEVCSRLFSCKSLLKKHMLVHTKIKAYVCKLCDKAFSRKEYLKVHTRIHTGERPFPCDVCGQRCISKERLTEHQRIHTGEKPFKCKICDHSFSQMGTMKRHFYTHKEVSVH